MRRGLDLVAPLALIAVLLALWEAGCRLADTPVYLLPPPSLVAKALLANLPLLVVSAWNTFAMALIALAVASASACIIALAAALSGAFERAVRPLAVALQVTPVVALAPLIQNWAGIDHPKVAVVALTVVVAFFPIYSGAVAGLTSADRDLERLFDLYGASPWQRLTRLRMPSAVPFLLEGHKVAVGLALVGAVVAEFAAGSGGDQGLAWRILEAGNHLQTDKMMAALVVLALMGGALHALFQQLERRALVWWRGR
ncbi:ABC transporter permease [Caulobacter sp. KR2-114]|uniref:ABC transporter permease n=1 Tax=Caulobacter sp. KR2-114 TaxID=3400912 RepID=UPI003BFCA33A